MPDYIIKGGKPLFGEVTIQGAKNSVLPLLAGALLTEDDVVLENCPLLSDVGIMEEILFSLGADVKNNRDVITVSSKNLRFHEIPPELAKKMRSSIFLLGSVLGRLKKAKVAYPGGCDIGLRPIDIHLKALRELGVYIEERNGYIYCDAKNKKCGTVTFDYPSVGATENIMLLMALSEGVTVINNAAREPEIEDLQNFLNKMGAEISGAGTPFITIIGKSKLSGCKYKTMPDRIVTGTYLCAAAICGGKITLKSVNSMHNKSLISKLLQSGCKIVENDDNIIIQSEGRIKSFGKIITRPYPGFPTDLQSPFSSVASVADGNTIIVENIFETRFRHIPELIKMGADIFCKDRVAVITGVNRLCGANVKAMDLRGGAGLILAGLNAKGTTTVQDVGYIQRGYQNIEEMLSKLGAEIIKK